MTIRFTQPQSLHEIVPRDENRCLACMCCDLPDRCVLQSEKPNETTTIDWQLHWFSRERERENTRTLEMERSHPAIFEYRGAHVWVLGHPLVFLQGQHVDAREVEVMLLGPKLAVLGRERPIEHRQVQLFQGCGKAEM